MTDRFRGVRVDWVIAAAIAAAFILRMFRVGFAPLWHDEVETAIWAGLHPGQIARTVVWRVAFGNYDPYQLPFYFVLVNVWTAVMGVTPFMLRFPSVMFSTVAVGLIAANGVTLVNRQAARWAAWLAAISPYLLHHAQEARGYALISMLAAASMLMSARFVTDRSKSLGVGFVLVNVALLATHYYSFFFVGAELLILVFFRRRPWKTWAFGAGGSFLAAVIVLCVALFFTPHRSGEIYQIGLVALPGVVWSMLSGYTLLPSSEELHAVGIQAVRPYLPYALCSVIPFLTLMIIGVRTLPVKSRVVILVILAAMITGPFLAYAVFPAISVNPRYFMAGAPALLVLIAAGMPTSIRSATRLGCAVVILTIMTIGVARHLADPGGKREDVLAAGQWLDTHVSPDEEILITSKEMASLASYYWPQRRVRLYPDSNVVATAKSATAVAAAIPFSDGARATYVFGRAWLSDPDGALQAAIEQRYALCPGMNARGIRIYCIMRPQLRDGLRLNRHD